MKVSDIRYLVQDLVGRRPASRIAGLCRHREAVDERLRMELAEIGKDLVDEARHQWAGSVDSGDELGYNLKKC
jgi:lipase chaperone LimK